MTKKESERVENYKWAMLLSFLILLEALKASNSPRSTLHSFSESIGKTITYQSFLNEGYFFIIFILAEICVVTILSAAFRFIEEESTYVVFPNKDAENISEELFEIEKKMLA
ncbi:hypothetical protein [Pseudoponticoccus marisrubri]|uniref:hypothetical protein n=1 Tax=Pseudoponticoccus marisrubri TaxID=1685382 RepID=UPI0012FD33A4|nr:hypothetical protein [Pseudoponticoccus marisrubri]